MRKQLCGEPAQPMLPSCHLCCPVAFLHKLLGVITARQWQGKSNGRSQSPVLQQSLPAVLVLLVPCPLCQLIPSLCFTSGVLCRAALQTLCCLHHAQGQKHKVKFLEAFC